MLRIREHGPVTEIRLTSTILGRPLYSVSAYYFEGTLIDSGPPRTGPELAKWAQSVEIDQIVNTHQHEDHVGGNAFLPGLPALAPAGALTTIRQAPRIPFYRWTTFGQTRPARAEPLGETISIRHHTLHVIPTPGHAPDHVALLLPERGWLFGGDLFIQEHARYVRRMDDVGQWLGSLRAILQYDFQILFCGHAGRVLEGKAAIRRKIAFWEEVQQQARALEGKGYSLDEIRKTLLGAEGILTWWSRGRFSKANLISALLSMPG